jgi:hypothetical protein
MHHPEGACERPMQCLYHLSLTAFSIAPAHWMALVSWKLMFLKASEGWETSWVPARQVVLHVRGQEQQQ